MLPLYLHVNQKSDDDDDEKVLILFVICSRKHVAEVLLLSRRNMFSLENKKTVMKKPHIIWFYSLLENIVIFTH